MPSLSFLVGGIALAEGSSARPFTPGRRATSSHRCISGTQPSSFAMPSPAAVNAVHPDGTPGWRIGIQRRPSFSLTAPPLIIICHSFRRRWFRFQLRKT